MKFEISSEEFKRSVERVTAILEKTIIPFAEQVHIFAEHNTVEFKMNNGNEFVSIMTNAYVINHGYISVAADRLKKLLNVKDNLIIIESTDDEEPILRAYSDKKKSEVPAVKHKLSEYIFPEVANTDYAAMEASRDDLLTVLGNLSKFASMVETNKLMCCYHFLPDRLETLDGHRIGIKWVDWNKHKANFSANIPVCIYKSLKKIINKNESGSIYMYLNERYAKFVGSDFDYIVKLVGGEFFDVNRFIVDSHDYKFTVSSKELAKISADYEKSAKAYLKPMYMHLEHNILITALLLPDYKTYDTVEIVDSESMPEELNIGFRPEYIKDAMDVLDGNVVIELDNANNPMHIIANGYRLVVLPVNISQVPLNNIF